jgi:hypothetical protein
MFTLAVWQGLQNDSIASGNTRLLMIFVGIVALSMASQAIIFGFMAYGLKKTQERVLTIVEELHTRAMPLINNAEDLTHETIPKIKAITENLVQTSDIVRAKAQELSGTVTDANRRTQVQVARIDGMISSALTATGVLAAMVHQGIKTPMTELLGVVNGVKAGIDVLTSKSKGFGAFTKRDKGAITIYKGE